MNEDSRHKPSRWSTIALVTAGPILVLVAVSARRLSGTDSGTLPSWIEALATLTAFIAAIWVARYAKQAATHARTAVTIEQARDRQREEADRRAQAVLVAAWPPPLVEMVGGAQTHTVYADGRQEHTHEATAITPNKIDVQIKNASNLPVRRFVIDLYARPADTADWLYIGSHLHGLIAPGALESAEIMTWQMKGRYHELLDPLPGVSGTPPEIQIGWGLVDNAGRRWRQVPSTESLEEDHGLPDRQMLSTRPTPD